MKLGQTLLSAAMRASLVVSPRPTVFFLRRAFAAGGAPTARRLEPHVPPGMVEVLDERYGDEPDMLLDVLRPPGAGLAPPTVVWVHGGGWIGGSKDELRGWFALVASNGYAVVAPRYSLAPGHRYPTPTRQVTQALAHVREHAGRLGLDPTRVALAGDSAGAQIAAQVGALATTPGYADAVGVAPTITADRLRGLVLACGPFDMSLFAGGGTHAGHRIVDAVGWAYSGRRRFLDDPLFATASVTNHVSPAFPPTLVTVGNADPLRPHSELLVERLRAAGVDVETLFFPPGHEPPLGHEYQFDLDGEAGALFFERMLEFLDRTLRDPAGR